MMLAEELLWAGGHVAHIAARNEQLRLNRKRVEALAFLNRSVSR